MAIVHELSWSTSRAATFADCRRQYYYEYYLSWRGWSVTAPQARRRAYLLKKMTRMPMLAGDIVHRAVARWFDGRQQGHVGTGSELARFGIDALREAYKESRDGGWKRRPSKSTRLAEHHYREPRIEEATGAAATYGKGFVERIRTCIRAFFADPELEGVRESEPRDWLALEEMGTIALFDTKVFAIPDFAHRDDGEVRIWDWKTGSPSPNDRPQLAAYVLYAMEKWDVAPADVICADVYLAGGGVAEERFSRGDVDATLGRIEASMDAMRALHFDADEGEGDPEHFPMIPAGSREARRCGFCNFRELCERA